MSRHRDSTISQALEENDNAAANEIDESNWLVAYADLMTLLFGFFAMMFTFVSFDQDGYVKVRKELARYFGGTYTNQANTTTESTEESIETRFKKSMGETAAGIDANLKVMEGGVEVSFITNIMFTTGGADLTEDAEKNLLVLVKILKDISEDPATLKTSGIPHILVEGHTDDTPTRGGKFPSNWELSAARAGRIVRLFEAHGFPSSTLSAVGYGSSRPAFPNREPSGKTIAENLKRNRRVIIKVYFPNPKKQG